MQARDLGEFELIGRLSRRFAAPDPERLIVGIGDDAAVWRWAGGTTVVATTDTMVAGVHFLPDRVAWGDVGWKALAVNISDIAAMGARPAFSLVTVALPPDTPVIPLEDLYDGIDACARAYDVTVAGGDIVAAAVFTITIALYGDATVSSDGAPQLLRRDAARAGEAIAVTGPLGGSGGGLRALLESTAASEPYAALVRRHMRPSPRVDAGLAAVAAGVRCGMDISDGLVQDLGHVCEAAGVGAEVWLDRVPLDADLVAAYPDDARAIAATGGEDYELLLVAPEDTLRRMTASHTIIGRMGGSGGVRVLDAGGEEVTFPASGWDHLRQP